MEQPGLQEAIALQKSGQSSQAREILLQILRIDPHQEAAWLWLVETIQEDTQRIAVLERCLKFNPQSQTARRALQYYQKKNAASAATPSPEPPPAVEDRPEPSPIPPPDDLDRLRADVSSENAPLQPEEPAEMQANSSQSTDESLLSGWIIRAETNQNPDDADFSIPENETTAISKADDNDPAYTPAIVHPPVVQENTEEIQSLREESENPPTPSQKTLLQRVIRAIILAGLAVLLIGVIIAAYLILTGRIETSFILPGRNASTQQATLDVLNQEKQQLETQVALGAPPPPSGEPMTLVSPAPSILPLPAPLYVLTDRELGRQVWRLEVDAQTFTPITKIFNGVRAFDLSPLDNTVAYLSENRLYTVGENGGDSTILLEGGELAAPVSSTAQSGQLDQPRWSPDGKTIALRRDGIILVDAASKAVTPLINDRGTTTSEPQFFYPEAWAPDGSQLLVRVQTGECSRLGLLTLQNRSLKLDLAPAGSSVFWSEDGRYVYSAVHTSGCACGSGSGLWRIDTRSAETEQIVRSEGKSEFVYFGFPAIVRPDEMVYFVAKWQGLFCENAPERLPVTMSVSSIGQVFLRQPLRSDQWDILFAKWAPNYAVAAVSIYPDQKLILLPSFDAPAIPINAETTAFAWAYPVSGSPKPTIPVFTPAPTSEVLALELPEIALNLNDLPADSYQVSGTSQPFQGDNVQGAYGVTIQSIDQGNQRVFEHDLVHFTSMEAAAQYFQKLTAEKSYPEKATVPYLAGQEFQASGELDPASGTSMFKTFQMIWRSGSVVHRLNLKIIAGPAINTDEIASLAKILDQRSVRAYPY